MPCGFQRDCRRTRPKFGHFRGADCGSLPQMHPARAHGTTSRPGTGGSTRGTTRIIRNSTSGLRPRSNSTSGLRPSSVVHKLGPGFTFGGTMWCSSDVRDWASLVEQYGYLRGWVPSVDTVGFFGYQSIRISGSSQQDADFLLERPPALCDTTSTSINGTATGAVRYGTNPVALRRRRAAGAPRLTGINY